MIVGKTNFGEVNRTPYLVRIVNNLHLKRDHIRYGKINDALNLKFKIAAANLILIWDG